MKGWMEDLVVDEAYRGKGVATSLIEKTIALAKEKGVKSLDFTSQPHREAANRLYERLGFIKRDTNVYRLVLG
jgi:ribosomal protein S18 acetylase RimI-like enzyme